MPIESIRNFVYWTSLIISTFLFVFSKTIREKTEPFLHNFGISQDAALVAVFFIGIFSLLCARLLSEGIPKYMVWVRRRLMPKTFVEGEWMDVVYESNNRTVKSVGTVKIAYQNGNLNLEGYDYSTNGDLRSSFWTILSRIYNTGEFRYCYEAKINNEPNFANHRSYGEYFFLIVGGKATEFSGAYTSSSDHQKYAISGDKVSAALFTKMGLPKQKYDVLGTDRNLLIAEYTKYKTRPQPSA